MALADVRQQALDLLTRGTTRPGRAGEALRPGESAVSPSARPFSPFISEHLQRAVNLADTLMAIADATPGEDGLRAALEEADRAMVEDPGAASHALMIFITHHAEGSQLPIPALEERQPEILDLSARAVADMARTDIDPEAALAWFRTDPLANQHHEHWHVVYPHEGVPDGHRPPMVQDRQGEIFLYMHQQMLARYAAERLAGGLAKVMPLSDYRATIAEGYEPDLSGYIGRPPNSHMRDVHLDPVHHPEQLYKVAQHEGFRDAIGMAIRDEHFTDQKPVEINSLGATVESTIASDSRPTYGNLHNLGHVLLALIGSSDDIKHGVMWSTGTAIMDPVFWQWHRHVDDFAFGWQEAQPSSDFGDSPAVLMRSTTAGASEDVAVCVAASVDGSGAAGFDWSAWGKRTFGGDAWPKPASDIEPATGELRTRIATRTAAGRGLPYLDHDDFVYVVRVENQRDAPTDVTVRIFLGPETSVEDRRTWIEMDKFHQQLRPRSRTVIVRPNRLSSVIQKPAHRPPQPRRTPGSDAAANYCNCGWPFNLLLPKGTPQGMPFRLMVMLSDWTIDQTGSDTACGSMSFCGARDARYPDSRPMGYPFDRRFPDGVIATLAALSNVGLHAISIRHESTPLSAIRKREVLPAMRDRVRGKPPAEYSPTPTEKIPEPSRRRELGDMTDGQERSKEFWFEFDNVFNPTFGHVPGEVMAAYTSLAAHDDGIDYPYQRWREHRKRGTYPDGFRAEMTSIQDPVLFLCAKQAEVLDRHFAGDPDAQRTAFEQFGEGVLFDQRRPVHQKVHQMDAALSPDSPPMGYYTWHGIIRAAVMVGADAGRWLAIDRSVGLAWGIHGEARPVQDAPDNPGLPPARLEQLRSTWLAFSFDELDTAFDSEPWPPGIDRNVASQRAPSDFDQLRAPRQPGNDEHQPG